MPDLIKVLLVEDELLWQQGVEALLDSSGHFSLMAVADSYDAAVSAFQKHQPQVVLLDWKIRGERDGLAVGDYLLQAGLPPERIVLISGSTPSSIPPHPFLFVPKSRLSDELLPLLESVLGVLGNVTRH